MTFTTDGLRIEGLFRTLQGDIMTAAGIIAIAVAALIVARRTIARTTGSDILDAATARAARTTANWLFAGVMLVTIAALSWRFATVTAVNRMPRADADTSGVYEQMKRNAGGGETKSPATR